jgi:hypothetical protein
MLIGGEQNYMFKKSLFERKFFRLNTGFKKKKKVLNLLDHYARWEVGGLLGRNSTWRGAGLVPVACWRDWRLLGLRGRGVGRVLVRKLRQERARVLDVPERKV